MATAFILKEGIDFWDGSSVDHHGYVCLPSLFCPGLCTDLGEEKLGQSALSLNNRNTGRQLPAPEGVTA